ncbi:glycosyltransferase family 10 domain-containing protein [Thalassococcus sp. S3]|uniref:glycosyltransferase family 10 domain-containing protein n=1 Tax=Thalassococcus sp. S3 TaxID=2017482 RepID=UPI001023F935|nr:glycosyltransferase family 10 [Thalassococcus sp. S3]QBF30922.1 hypothetical protein CFI11_06785 [Thalassococcus sp. S3]
MTEPAIAILPYGKTLGRRSADLPLSDLIWPLGCPDRLRDGRLRDLGSEDHLIVYPKTELHIRPDWGTRARVSLVMGEPSVIHARHIRLLRLSWRRFFRVLTFSERLLGRIPNALFFPFGTTWVPEWQSLPNKKIKMMSLIASAKRDTEGHMLRHETVDWVRSRDLDVDVMGRGYTPFERKADGLAPYRFSVVIENVRERNYFSEKLVDAVLCGTVPIYWGCPNLSDFVETDGLVICENADEVRAAILAASEAQYQALCPELERIQPELARHGDLEKRAAEAIRDAL